MRRLLIVDDHEGFRSLLREILTSLFPAFLVDEAADASEAMQRMADVPPDLIFMDIALPGENGFQLTTRIMEAHPSMPVVIVTNNNIPEYRQEAGKRGARGFISKCAMNRNEIASLITSILGEAAPKG